MTKSGCPYSPRSGAVRLLPPSRRVPCFDPPQADKAGLHAPLRSMFIRNRSPKINCSTSSRRARIGSSSPRPYGAPACSHG